MGVDEQETVEVVGARMIATAQLFGREADAMHAYEFQALAEREGGASSEGEDACNNMRDR